MMCGFWGITGARAAAELQTAAIAALAHRGPDACRHLHGEGIALAHARLAVIDLTDAADQPMQTRDGRFAIVYNGEIYNHHALREELEREGVRFRTRSDTEVILNGFRCWGAGVLKRLRGMFAFAIWDAEAQRLFAARDRIGIKPFCYARVGDELIFASEAKALFVHPALTRRIAPRALGAYLAWGYVPAPSTIYDGVEALPPATALEWHNGRLRSYRYWRAAFSAGRHERMTVDAAIENLDHHLNDAIRHHLVADVPVAAFLSGGVDSSLVAAVAQRHMDRPLQTFTIGFGPGDERRYARLAARHIGTRHRERVVAVDLAQQLPRLVWHLDQPLYDNSILPTYLVSKMAAGHVKVVLSGDGGDEPFGGYDWTRYALLLPDVTLCKAALGSRGQWGYRAGAAGLVRRVLADLGGGADFRYLRRTRVTSAMIGWLLTEDWSSRIGLSDQAFVVERQGLGDLRDRFLRQDLCSYLPDDVLFKVDRMSMAHGLEVRVPLLDHILLEWLLTLPFNLRFRWGRGKYILRRLAERYLPDELLKPRKQGFTIPIDRWLRSAAFGDLVAKLFSGPTFRRRGIVRPQAALAMLHHHRSGRYNFAHRIWSIVVLETWMRVWLDGQPPDMPLSEMILSRP